MGTGQPRGERGAAGARAQGSFGEAQIPERRGRNAQLEAINAAISRYRALFAQRGLGEALLRELDAQLEAQGLFIEPGRTTLMDATHGGGDEVG